MIMITPHETLLLIYLHIEMGDFGDIDRAMVDLHRTVHVQINHCNIIDIFFTMQMLFFIMQMIWSIRPTRCLRGLSTLSRCFLSLSSTSCWSNGKWREREICLMWNNDGTATENNKRVWFCLMWNNSLVSFMLEQRNLTREKDCFCLMWNSFTNQASNEIWFAMTVVMKILSFNIYKAMEQKPSARSNRNVQIDQNSNLTI